MQESSPIVLSGCRKLELHINLAVRGLGLGGGKVAACVAPSGSRCRLFCLLTTRLVPVFCCMVGCFIYRKTVITQ
jgi:uncharacterized transporter YbjL